MPKNFKNHVLTGRLFLAVIMFTAASFTVQASEGIGTYYIRYDVKSSSNKIVDDELLMIPAKNDFRAEKFSQMTATGVISAAPGDSNGSIENRIRDNALKTILINNGLKSVTSKDRDTVISYEGVMIRPVIILKNTYNKKQDRYFYEAQLEFSPIAFPDKWEALNLKYKIKELFQNFFQFFN